MMESALNTISKELRVLEEKLGMSKHTPGPWIVSTGRRYGHVLDCYGVIVAELDVDRPFCEVMGNCYLIAAAPDMLETLRDIVGMLTDTSDMRSDALHAARAAIVRATGGQQ